MLPTAMKWRKEALPMPVTPPEKQREPRLTGETLIQAQSSLQELDWRLLHWLLRYPLQRADDLVLRSLKAIRKEAAMVAMILGRTSPDPWVGSLVELSGRHASGLLNLIGIGKALPRKGITTEEAPPALLQIEPAGSFGNEDVVNAGVLGQPSAGFSAVMAAEIISNDEDISGRIVGFNVGQRGNVALGVARSGTPGQHLAITHP